MAQILERVFVTVDGLKLAGSVAGSCDGPAVILLHGGGQTRHSWDGAMRRLSDQGYFVVSYDARGHGDSDWSPDGDYSLAALSADMHAVLSHVPSPRALVGASMGGMTSFYTVAHADTVIADALVLVDIVLRPNAEGSAKIRDFMLGHPDGFGTLEEAADAVAAYNPRRGRPSHSAGLMKNLRLREDGRLYWH